MVLNCRVQTFTSLNPKNELPRIFTINLSKSLKTTLVSFIYENSVNYDSNFALDWYANF